MNLQQLEHVLAVVQTGSFSRAAEQVFLTQSALSRSIQGLEQELGGLLFDRLGRTIEPTELGLLVAQRARQIVQDLAELKQSAGLLRDEVTGRLRVGLGSGPGRMLAVPWLCEAAHSYPKLHTAIVRGPTSQLLHSLRERQLDVLVVDIRSVVPDTDLRIEAETTMRAGWICRADHPLVREVGRADAQRTRPLAVDAVLQYPIATTQLSDEVARHLVTTYHVGAHPEAMTRLRSEDVTTLLQAVEQSDAVFVGIVAAAAQEIAQQRMIELAVDPPMPLGARYAIVTLQHRTELPALRAFRAFVLRHLHD